MAIDSTLSARRVGMARLREPGPVVDIVADRVHSQAMVLEPVWPFVKWGAPVVSPISASCLDGAEIDLAVHGYAKGRKEDGQVVETAEDFASRLGAAIAKMLDRYSADIPGGRASFRWRGSRLQADETDGFHSIQLFRVRCVTV